MLIKLGVARRTTVEITRKVQATQIATKWRNCEQLLDWVDCMLRYAALKIRTTRKRRTEKIREFRRKCVLKPIVTTCHSVVTVIKKGLRSTESGFPTHELNSLDHSIPVIGTK